MPKLYFMIGIQGSGKSTYIKKNFNPEVVVSSDDLRRKFTGDVTNFTQEGKVWAQVPILLKQKLEKYGEAVSDSTNVDSGDRKRMLKNFDRNSVERIAIVFEADPEESKRRIKADIDAGKDRSNVPPEIVDKFQEKFKRGFKAIKQQFDKVIYADRGDNVMSNKTQKEDIQKMRKMIVKEMKLLKEEDAKEAMERAEYQAYQDMYLTPQSNWRVKKYTEMYDGSGNLYRGKIGEIHRIQTVEYDFMHTGEVVTECGDMTYSMNAEDFRNSFEMINDEEGLKVNNESVENNINFGKGQIVKFTNNMANLHVSKGDEIEIISNEYGDGMGVPSFKIKNLRNNKIYEVEKTLLQTAFDKNYAILINNEGIIKEDILSNKMKEILSNRFGYELYEDFLTTYIFTKPGDDTAPKIIYSSRKKTFNYDTGKKEHENLKFEQLVDFLRKERNNEGIVIESFTIVRGPNGETYRKGDKFRVIKGYNNNPFSFTVDSYVHSQTGGSPGHSEIIPNGSIIEFDAVARNGNVWFVYDGKDGYTESGDLRNILSKGLLEPVENESIKEEIKKLVKVKDYFGKTIKESIEKLEKTFLSEDSDDDYLEQDFDDSISEPGYDETDNRLYQTVFPVKTEGRYMIFSDSTDKDFGESFGTIPAAESRIEDLEKKFGRNSFFIKDRTTGREV